MKVRAGYDDSIQFAGFGSSHAVSDYVPVKKQKSKIKVGFAIPKKSKKGAA